MNTRYSEQDATRLFVDARGREGFYIDINRGEATDTVRGEGKLTSWVADYLVRNAGSKYALKVTIKAENRLSNMGSMLLRRLVEKGNEGDVPGVRN